MNDQQQLTLWIGSLRYHLGRRTYAVSNFCELLIQEWPQLSSRTKFIIQRDVEEEFDRDDRHRQEGGQFKALGGQLKPLGHDCDRACWERVRKLWKE